MSDESSGITKAISFGGALIAMAVSLNALVNSCTERQLSSHSSFRETVRTEEDFWKQMYDDYLTIFSKDISNNPEAKKAKLLGLHSLAQREIPKLTEFSSIGEEVDAAKERLGQMKSTLLSALEADSASDKETAETLRNQSFQVAVLQQNTELQKKVIDNNKDQNPFNRKPIRSTVNIRPGKTSGWDLDFYWCPMPGKPNLESFNYNQAVSLANGFANFAEEGRSFIPNQKIGRIRVKPVSGKLRKLVNVDWERWVTWNEGFGEEASAKAVQKRIASVTNQEFKIARSTGKPTPYYTSIFSCSKSVSAR